MKMKVLMASLIAVLFCACALEGVNVIGPAGGFVFYDKGNYSDGWRYLECSPVDAGEVGLKHISSRDYTYDHEKIKKLCNDFLYNGYNDWRLPNDNELYTMLNAFKRSFRDTTEIHASNYVSSENTTYHVTPYNKIKNGVYYPIDYGEVKFIARPVRQF